jgi:hypothetical protein
MRYTTKRKMCVSILAVYAMTALQGCTVDIGKISAPNPSVATVSIAITPNTLWVGQSARASVVVKDSAGKAIADKPVVWISRTPEIATVDSVGDVTGVGTGSATIEGSVDGSVGVLNVDVVLADRWHHDFNDSTLGDFHNPWGTSIDFPQDPTNSGRGRVARVFYAPTTANTSDDKGFGYNSGTDHIRYGRTIWFKGDLYFPSSGSAHRRADNRKLLYYSGTGANMILARRDDGAGPELDFYADDYMNGSLQETAYSRTGIVLNDDTWYTLEVMIQTNSRDNVRDGVVEIYINGESTPRFRRTTGLGWITDNPAYPGGTYFKWFLVGAQLSINYPTDPLYTEYRYWDNFAFSSTRLTK